MSAISMMTVEAVERDLAPGTPGTTAREVMPGGIALSATLHVGMLLLIVLGLPSLFHHPPPQEQPIAVALVTIAPETKATHPNPFRPKPEAKPEPPIAAPAPKPEPKPEPPQPVPEPPAAAAPPPLPAPPEPVKPEVKTPPLPPPPPPKPVEAQAPPPPPPRPPEPKPKPEPQRVQHAPRPETAKADPKAFDKLLQNLEDKHPQPAAFDNLLKNLTRQQVAEADEAPPAPHRMAATAPPSSQPKAPLGSRLTASDIDLVREQLRPCFNPPFGAKEKPDLVADIRVVMNRDGTVQQARVDDQGQYASDQIYRAVADSGIRALKNPRCSPLRLPPDRYEVWQSFIFGFSTKDMQ
ncbi:MAG TPA: hypothetical protein VIM52_10210 [Stellaceae bacterium]